MVTGCGRSGTKYLSKIFRLAGYDIAHEKLGRDGIVSASLVPDTNKVPWGPSFREVPEMPIVHQVREPLATIASTTTGHPKSWLFMQKHTSMKQDDSTLLKAMKFWYEWNLMAEEKACFTYRIEDIEEVFPRLLATGGFPTTNYDKDIFKVVSKKVNSRPHKTYTWEDLEKEDKKLASKIMLLAERYGYEVKNYGIQTKGNKGQRRPKDSKT